MGGEDRLECIEDLRQGKRSEPAVRALGVQALHRASDRRAVEHLAVHPRVDQREPGRDPDGAAQRDDGRVDHVTVKRHRALERGHGTRLDGELHEPTLIAQRYPQRMTARILLSERGEDLRALS